VSVIVGYHAQSLDSLDMSVDIGYYNTTKELFRTLLFNVLKKTEDGKDWVLPANVGLWPNYFHMLCLTSKC
jgi:hypothetical protein